MRILVLLLLFSVSVVSAQTMRIGLFWSQQISNVIFTPVTGSYAVIADGKKVASIGSQGLLQLLATRDSVVCRFANGETVNAFKIQLFSDDSSHFKIRSVSPDLPTKSFNASLEFSSVKGFLKIINYVHLDTYASGVVESEVGSRAPAEYYKSQAILCRTYALSHLRRHETEGFHLCDKVHCQVYKSRSVKNPKILEAVASTKGLVLVDEKLELITAAFHSNCGGQTANSEDVWNKHVSYLRSVKDTFCLREPNATWQKEIPAVKWMHYVETVCSYPASDSNYRKLVCSIEPTTRNIFLGDQKHSILTREVRSDFNLKSAYFGITTVEDKVRLNGKGYGHGVGLCQEGAMRMARLGRNYSQILHFYFTKVNIVNVADLDFFKLD